MGSKMKKINNAYQGYLNSFGFTVLVIHFLQFRLNQNETNCSLGDLVFRFFEFYAMRWNTEKHAISIHHKYSSQPFRSKTFNTEIGGYSFMEIRDYDDAQNVAQRVGKYQTLRIKQEFVSAFECIQKYKDSKQDIFDLLVNNNNTNIINTKNNQLSKLMMIASINKVLTNNKIKSG